METTPEDLRLTTETLAAVKAGTRLWEQMESLKASEDHSDVAKCLLRSGHRAFKKWEKAKAAEHLEDIQEVAKWRREFAENAAAIKDYLKKGSKTGG